MSKSLRECLHNAVSLAFLAEEGRAGGTAAKLLAARNAAVWEGLTPEERRRAQRVWTALGQPSSLPAADTRGRKPSGPKAL